MHTHILTYLHTYIPSSLPIFLHACLRGSSRAMYGGRLECADEVCAHKLADLVQVQETEETLSALCLVDTAGCEMGEEHDESGSSFNEGEALVVREYLQRLLDLGIAQEQIGILTPYSAQVSARNPAVSARCCMRCPGHPLVRLCGLAKACEQVCAQGSARRLARAETACAAYAICGR